MALLVGLVAASSGGSPARADEASDWKALIELRERIGAETFRSQPAEAVSQLQQFYSSHRLDPILAAEVVLQVAELTREKLQDPQRAQQMLQSALEAELQKSDTAKPVAVMYLDGLAAGLLAEQRADKAGEVQTLLQTHRPRILAAARSGHPHLEQFASRVLQRQDDALQLLRAPGEQPTGTITLLKVALGQMPVFLHPERQKSVDWREGWMYQRLIEALVQSGQNAEAAQWARLYYAEASYDQSAIESATRAVNSVWVAQSDFAKVRAFAQAQLTLPTPATAPATLPTQTSPTNAGLANPLAAVTLPSFDDQTPLGALELEADLTRLRLEQARGPWRGRMIPIITLELARGQWGLAMQEAQAMLASEPGAADGPQQIARVFKAKDASIARANQFLAYLEGKAANPLPDFLAEVNAPGSANAQGDATR